MVRTSCGSHQSRFQCLAIGVTHLRDYRLLPSSHFQASGTPHGSAAARSVGAARVGRAAVGLTVNRPRTVAYLLATAMLGGCLSVAELRSSTPKRTGEVAGHYLPLAECVVAKARQEHQSHVVSYQIEDIPAARTARVVATARYPGGLFYTVPTAVVELTFREPDDGNVKVEARSGPLGRALESDVWPLIGECAPSKGA